MTENTARSGGSDVSGGRRARANRGRSPSCAFESEHSRAHSAIEWWFCQGHYRGRRSGCRHFMVTLFRSNLRVLAGGEGHGFQLMTAVLDPRHAGGHTHATWVDPALVEWAVKRARSAEPHVDPTVWRAFSWLLEHEGPPHPIQKRPRPPAFNADPLRITWGGFSLAQRGGVLSLGFREPQHDRAIALHLEAAAPRMEVRCGSDVVPLGAGMDYRTYPRVRIHGTADGDEPVSGECWMDHQWGPTDWFHDPHAGGMLGWDWFGMTLDDGADLLVMRHRNAQSGTTVGMHATLRERTGATSTVHEFSLTPLRTWESPATFIEHPVEWRIEVPALGIDCRFEPLRDNQELASFGTMRAVWEGAGQVRGLVRGRAASGLARGEFHGYGYVFDHRDFVAQMCRRVDRHLEELLPRRFDAARVEHLVGRPTWAHEIDAYTDMFSVPVWDLMDRSGKRWRPVFGILLLECLGVSSAPYEGLISCTLEFVHAGALIIDDIEDDSSVRRGAPSLHLRYGLDVAISAGNTLYFLPGHTVRHHPLLTPRQRTRWLEIKERICIEAHCGQATDIFWSRRMEPASLACMLSEDIEGKILQMYAFKTAAAATGAAEFVCALADADARLTAACVDFARTLGVAYQIVDDIHNFSRSPDWGKVTGEDLANGKLTFVVARALRRLPATQAARLQDILCDAARRNHPEVLDEGIELVQRSGALEECRATARKMVDTAWAGWSRWTRPSGPKVMLHTMCLRLIELAHED